MKAILKKIIKPLVIYFTILMSIILSIVVFILVICNPIVLTQSVEYKVVYQVDGNEYTDSYFYNCYKDDRNWIELGPEWRLRQPVNNIAITKRLVDGSKILIKPFDSRMSSDFPPYYCHINEDKNTPKSDWGINSEIFVLNDNYKILQSTDKMHIKQPIHTIRVKTSVFHKV